MNDPRDFRPTLMLVDDDRDFAEDLAAVLTPRYAVHLFHDGSPALAAMAEVQPDVVLLDLDFGHGRDLYGMEILERIRGLASPPPVLMLTGNQDRDVVVEAVQLGAFHYLVKPPEPEEMFNLLMKAVDDGVLRRQIREERAHSAATGNIDVVAVDPGTRRVFDEVEQVADTDTTVLITGETGTGKEVVAKRLHQLSGRKDGPHIIMNCAAFHPNLIDSELFGHERGAYTDAQGMRRGRLELAHKGTLFLDEVGELPFDLQAKFLRALEQKTFERVGGERTHTSDVRLVAATHRDLMADVEAGRFRRDLFYRLSVFTIHVPPLRERRDDVIPLARLFLAKFAAGKNRDVNGFTPHAERTLLEYRWPGNVRELSNVIENAVVRARRPLLGIDVLRFESNENVLNLPPYPEWSSAQALRSKAYYVRVQLERAEGNVTRAADISGVQRSAFQKMMRDCDIKSEEFRDD